MSIAMLDLDPVKAAQAHVDSHVGPALTFVVQHLANAWHELYSSWALPLDAPPLCHDLVQRIVPDSAHPRPSIPLHTYEADGPARPGDKPVWLLAGQRIPQKATETHSSGLWLRQLGGNYSWAWRFGVALNDELGYRSLRLMSPAAVVERRALYTLEILPPPLEHTQGDWSEAPLTMPDYFKQSSDGFYDTVQSWRVYYAHKHERNEWRAQRPPDWLEEAQKTAKRLTAPE